MAFLTKSSNSKTNYAPAHGSKGRLVALPLQTKLRMGRPNDVFEQEANRVAEQVVNVPAPESIQRQVKEEKTLQPQMEEEESSATLQPKLRQPYITQFTAPSLWKQVANGEEETLQPQMEEEEPSETLQPKLRPPYITQFTAPSLFKQVANGEEETIQPQAAGQPHITPNVMAAIQSSRATGLPLPLILRRFMEPRFQADFSNVKIHTDEEAAQFNQLLRSQAFTLGNHIFFAKDKFQPDSQSGRALIAHELTHTIQQGAAIQRQETTGSTPSPTIQTKCTACAAEEERAIQRQAATADQPIQTPGGMVQPHPTISRSPVNLIQRLTWGEMGGAILEGFVGTATSLLGGVDAARRAFLGFLRNLIRRVPGYRLLTVILRRDPIAGEGVERNGRNFIEAGLDVIPRGRLLQQKLEQIGALEEAAAWLDEQIAELDIDPEAILAKFSEIDYLTNPLTTLRCIQRIFQPPIQHLFRFAERVGRRLLQIVKDYVISEVIEFIRERTRAYPLLTVILEEDPISGEAVPRSGINLIRGFMELSENGAEQLWQMEATGSLQRAADWIDGAVARLTRNFCNIRNGFNNIWNSVTIENLMNPRDTFTQIYQTFAEPVEDIWSFLVEVSAQILGFIKDALLERLSAFARNTRGYPLLTVILGRDPFTGEEVPRTARHFIRGFLILLPEGDLKVLMCGASFL